MVIEQHAEHIQPNKRREEKKNAMKAINEIDCEQNVVGISIVFHFGMECAMPSHTLAFSVTLPFCIISLWNYLNSLESFR